MQCCSSSTRSVAYCAEWLFLLLTAVSVSATPALEIIGAPTQVNTRDKQIVFYVKANEAQISYIKCELSSLLSDRGDSPPLDTFECKAPEVIGPEKIENVVLSVASGKSLRRGSYTATLQLVGLDPKGTPIVKTINFKILAPAVSLKVGDVDTIRIRMTRNIPIFPATETVLMGVRIMNDVPPTEVPKQVPSELYVQNGTNKDLLPQGYLKAVFREPQTAQQDSNSQKDPPPSSTSSALDNKEFEIEASVPAGVKEANGVIRLRSNEFASDLEIPVTLLVKDRWIYAAIVVVFAQFMSFLISRWFSSGRQRRLNKIALSPVQTGLVNLLLRRPDLIDHTDVAVINGFLDDAVQANKLGDLELAKSRIKAAQEKLDRLKDLQAPQQPPILPAPSVLLVQSGYSYVGGTLNFVVVNPSPNWSHVSFYKWEWSGADNKWQTLYEGPNLTNISTTFWKKGRYNVRVSVDAAEIDATSVQLEYDKSRISLRNIAISDYAIALLAVVFGAMLSYLAIDKLDTFGTVSDYALAFLAGFGLSSTTSGFSAVLSRFQANAGPTAPTQSP